jgi:hypothetical protein
MREGYYETTPDHERTEAPSTSCCRSTTAVLGEHAWSGADLPHREALATITSGSQPLADLERLAAVAGP